MFRRVSSAVTCRVSLASRHASTKWYSHNTDGLDEWVTIDDAAKTATIGVTKAAMTNFLRGYRGDTIFVVLYTRVGDAVRVGELVAAFEFEKISQPVYSPFSGLVEARNAQLGDNCKVIVDDPEGAGWIVKLDVSKHAVDTSKLLNREQYDTLCVTSHQR